MKKLLLTGLLFLSLYFAFGQQLHFTSQYMQHNSMYNPGAAGISNRNMIGASYRSMWSSFPGNPKTYMVYGDAELRKVNSGIGAYLYRDETGPSRRTGVQMAYSYHIIPRSEKYRIGLGLELRGLQYAIDKTKLQDALGNDPVLSGASDKFAFDAGAGIYYTNYKLSLGASVSQLMGSKLELANVPGITQGGKLYRHYNIIANYKWNAGEDIYVIPNVLVRLIENSPSEYDLGLMINYREIFWWGLNWRVKQSWSIQAGLRIAQRIALAYCYDYYQTPLNLFNEGTGAHELGLQFSFDKK
jgi:type IX secretion system PorP/SprF family membrane protein